LNHSEHKNDNLPDVLARWRTRGAEAERPRNAQSFLVPKVAIVGQNYDLSIKKYKEIEYEEVKYDKPLVILQQLNDLEKAIQKEMRELEAMLA
jgi:type I restriction enzyme M protein